MIIGRKGSSTIRQFENFGGIEAGRENEGNMADLRFTYNLVVFRKKDSKKKKTPTRKYMTEVKTLQGRFSIFPSSSSGPGKLAVRKSSCTYSCNPPRCRFRKPLAPDEHVRPRRRAPELCGGGPTASKLWVLRLVSWNTWGFGEVVQKGGEGGGVEKEWTGDFVTTFVRVWGGEFRGGDLRFGQD